MSTKICSVGQASYFRPLSLNILIHLILSLIPGMTALHQAVLDSNLSVVRILITHGARINKQDADSWTALHAACANGNADIAK